MGFARETGQECLRLYCRVQAERRSHKFSTKSKSDAHHEGAGGLHEADDGNQNTQNRAQGCPSREVVHERLEAKNAQYPAKIVAECHEAPLAAHLVEAADQEVAIAGAAFEGT